jgi:mannose-6-phosphate isomerase-like protein (cupin superfamily)
VIVVQRTVQDTDEMAKLPPALLDDGRNWERVKVIKPWGHEEEIKREGVVSVTMLYISPGGETSMHCHPGKSALLTVCDGYCELETLDVVYKLRPGQTVNIEPGAFHRLRTEGGTKVIEIESPANKNNIVRLMDKYGRGQGYNDVSVNVEEVWNK